MAVVLGCSALLSGAQALESLLVVPALVAWWANASVPCSLTKKQQNTHAHLSTQTISAAWHGKGWGCMARCFFCVRWSLFCWRQHAARAQLPAAVAARRD